MTSDYWGTRKVAPRARARSKNLSNLESKNLNRSNLESKNLRDSESEYLTRVREAWTRLGHLYRIEVRPLSQRQEAWLLRVRTACRNVAGSDGVGRADRALLEMWGLWAAKYGTPGSALRAGTQIYEHVIRDSLVDDE